MLIVLLRLQKALSLEGNFECSEPLDIPPYSLPPPSNWPIHRWAIHLQGPPFAIPSYILLPRFLFLLHPPSPSERTGH